MTKRDALKRVCTRPERSLAHYRTLQALPLILGKEKEGDATYLDKCRKTRNTAEYDQIGVTTVSDAEELIEFVEDLKFEAKQWLKSNHKDISGV
jgi:hypothetical protein